MTHINLSHFNLSAQECVKQGDNDTLPYDQELSFYKDQISATSKLAYDFFTSLQNGGNKFAISEINKLELFSERLLVATGPHGFRISTKISPFWNIYFNALGAAIAEKLEPKRFDNAHSYRYAPSDGSFFDRSRSWKGYREATLNDDLLSDNSAIVVQTDISSFYEHIYHHRIQNSINDLFSEHSTISNQIIRLLTHFSAGRSFGFPVGGQCARILAELMMHSIDDILTSENIRWHRYVDDFVLITDSPESAYKALSTLSYALADYGLSLNRTKTTILTAKHYRDYINTQLFSHAGDAGTLRDIDIYFDPYSDNPESDYEDLKDTVQQIDIKKLLQDETVKSQSDSYLIKQISRAIKYQTPEVAAELISTLLDSKNINAFRASFPTIMRGIFSVVNNSEFARVHSVTHKLIDDLILYAGHLLLPEANCLHFLKCLPFIKTDVRSRFLSDLYSRTKSIEVKKSCIFCWGRWKDRPQFIRLVNNWSQMPHEEQLALWRSSYDFGDEGKHFRSQKKNYVVNNWIIGVKLPSHDQNGDISYEADPLPELYIRWAQHDQ